MKPSSKLPIVIAALVLVVIAATLVLRGQDTGPGQVAEGAAEAQRVAPPEASAPPLRGAAAAPGVSSEAIDSQIQRRVSDRTRMREDHAARISALREQSAARYASETVDAAWAPVKESELSTIASQPEFDEVGAQPAELSVGCRTSMCRLDAKFENRTQAENWIMMYSSSVGSSMPNSVVSRSQDPDGSTRVEIYGRAR